MAGTIEIERNVRWSAASWLFDWVVQSLAAVLPGSEAAARLNEIVDEHLGWLALDDLPLADRVVLRDSMCRDLLDHAERQLPANLAGRERVLDSLKELVQLSCRSLESNEPE
jgi:hypothetical protein